MKHSEVITSSASIVLVCELTMYRLHLVLYEPILHCKRLDLAPIIGHFAEEIISDIRLIRIWSGTKSRLS